MVIDKRSDRLLGSGVYADVFEFEARAYKLFKSGPEIPPRQTKEGRRRVFDGQCRAFRSLSNDLWLQTHTGEFHGVCVVDDVIGSDGTSNRDDYLLDCCYMLEILDLGGFDPETALPRNEIKLNVLKHKHLREAAARFKTLGIATLDSSVFYPSDPDKFKFIDIEIEN